VSDPPSEPRDEELEELGDEVILAQESAVHVPQPRQNVTTDHPSVVISEPEHAAGKRATVRTARRELAEKTVVIRDRRKLEEMRRVISEREQLKQPKPRVIEPKTLYLLVAAAVGSLVIGTLIAAFVDSQRGPATEPLGTGSATAPARPSAEGSAAPLDTVNLEELPVQRKPRRRTP
jgi:hypothetical protein